MYILYIVYTRVKNSISRILPTLVVRHDRSFQANYLAGMKQQCSRGAPLDPLARLRLDPGFADDRRIILQSAIHFKFRIDVDLGQLRRRGHTEMAIVKDMTVTEGRLRGTGRTASSRHGWKGGGIRRLALPSSLLTSWPSNYIKKIVHASISLSSVGMGCGGCPHRWSISAGAEYESGSQSVKDDSTPSSSAFLHTKLRPAVTCRDCAPVLACVIYADSPGSYASNHC